MRACVCCVIVIHIMRHKPCPNAFIVAMNSSSSVDWDTVFGFLDDFFFFLPGGASPSNIIFSPDESSLSRFLFFFFFSFCLVRPECQLNN